jgi:zinc transporter ZupT
MLGFAAGTLLASGLGEILPEALASTGVVALAWAAGRWSLSA